MSVDFSCGYDFRLIYDAISELGAAAAQRERTPVFPEPRRMPSQTLSTVFIHVRVFSRRAAALAAAAAAADAVEITYN